jgi:hypothetical protein
VKEEEEDAGWTGRSARGSRRGRTCSTAQINIHLSRGTAFVRAHKALPIGHHRVVAEIRVIWLPKSISNRSEVFREPLSRNSTKIDADEVSVN